jgi:hypothetical protein
MKKVSFIIFTLAITSSLSCKVHKEITSNGTKVFLLAGQSNMDGRARAYKLSTEDKIRLKKVQKNVTLYYNFDEGQPLGITKASEYVKKTFNTAFVFGPELFFGIKMSEKYPNHKIVLIKRSRGNMSLYGAWNPDWTEEKALLMKEEKQPKLYNEFVTYSKQVLSKLEKNLQLCGVLWVQGEADSDKIKTSNKSNITYESNLNNLVNRIRIDFNHPNLPFLLFQVGNGKVLEGMRNVSKHDENVVLIKQEKSITSPFYYEQNPPPIWHYTYKSMKKIGISFFNSFEQEFTSR